jgi:hypothetical protein
MSIEQVLMEPQKWQDHWEAYKGEPQQVSAVWMLYQHIKESDPGLLAVHSQWADKFKEKAKPVFPNPLKIKWQNQNDNQSGTGYRECFSSSCAMLAIYKGKLSNDDEYNQIRAGYGDSTDAQVQLAALRSLGLRADFRTDGTLQLLKQEIDSGNPVAVGWLHHGSASAPSGGGHWTVAAGYGDSYVIMMDPNGEADLVNGGYTPNMNGAGIHYSYKNWMPRWRVGGEGGWMLTCR